MEQNAPTAKSSRRWLRSLLVLLIGLAYLGGVYWASPALRQEMRTEGVWYGWPLLPPPATRYRVVGDRSLRGFDKRLVKRAESTARVRMTMEVVQRSRYVTAFFVSRDGRKNRPLLSPVRERCYKVTLAMERAGSRTPPERVRLLIEGEASWRAWVLDGRKGWYLASDTSSYMPEEVRRPLSFGDLFMSHEDELEPIERDKMVPLWPFVCPSAFENLLSRTRVSLEGEAELDGVPCRAVRIQRDLGGSIKEVCKLWMPEGEDRVVKVEYAPPWAPDFVEQLAPEELAELGTFCVVTSYEEPASFSQEDFDPAPLVKRWGDAVAASVERDLKDLEEHRAVFPPGDFGGGFEDELGPAPGDESGDRDHGNDTPPEPPDGGMEQ